jgi:two-component system cell cycle sensor histidine kinase/response regulator CckA
MEVATEAEILGIPFAKSPYPMWVFDTESLGFLEVNDAAIERYGFSRTEFLHMSLLDIRPASDAAELLRRTQNPRPTGQCSGEIWRHLAKNGKVFSVTITSWALDFRGRHAELVLARPEKS